MASKVGTSEGKSKEYRLPSIHKYFELFNQITQIYSMSRLKKMKTGFISFGKNRQCVHRLDKAHGGCDVCYECKECRFSKIVKIRNSLSFKRREGFLLKKEPKETESGQEVLRIRPAKPFLDCIVN